MHWRLLYQRNFSPDGKKSHNTAACSLLAMHSTSLVHQIPELSCVQLTFLSLFFHHDLLQSVYSDGMVRHQVAVSKKVLVLQYTKRCKQVEGENQLGRERLPDLMDRVAAWLIFRSPLVVDGSLPKGLRM
jgi:hypothetical protein